MRPSRFMFVAVAAAVALVAAPSQASPVAGPVDRGHIDAYTATVTPEQRSQLARQGHDLSEQGRTKDEVQLYLTPSQADEVRKLGINPQLTRVKGGKTVREFAAEQALNGFNVWRSYDEVGGIRDQMYAAAAANSSIAKLVKLGNTVQGREILAVKLTQGAPGQVDGSRPAVLYSSTQHAREWISTEVNRLVHRQVEGQRSRRQGAAPEHRAVVRSRGEPGWLPVHLRSRTPLAKDVAGQ